MIVSLLNGGFGGNQFSVQYNKINNTYIIGFVSATSDLNARATLLFGSGTNKSKCCNKLMGFGLSDVVILSRQTRTSGMILMNDIAYLQIKSDIGDATTFITGDETMSLLEVIPVSSEPLSYISYAPFQPNKFLLHNANLTEIKIGLIDNYGRDVNLNGVPFLLTIKIDVVSTEEAGLPKAAGREVDEPDQMKTNLELINENPGIINRPTEREPLSMNDYIEYRLIQEMLRKIDKKLRKKK
jgi:hypothetical protein